MGRPLAPGSPALCRDGATRTVERVCDFGRALRMTDGTVWRSADVEPGRARRVAKPGALMRKFIREQEGE